MEVLQTSALPLGDGAPLTGSRARLKPSTTYFDCTRGNGSADLKDRTTAFDEACAESRVHRRFNHSASEASGAKGAPRARGRIQESAAATNAEPPKAAKAQVRVAKRQRTYQTNGAGNGIRTRDFDLGKVALYH